MNGDPKDGKIKMADGSYQDKELLYESISNLKQMGLTHIAIAKTLNLPSAETVSRHWKKIQESNFMSRTKVPNAVLKGEVMVMLKTLRKEAFQMLSMVNKKTKPSLFVNCLKAAKDMAIEEIKFLERMKILKPEEDKMQAEMLVAESMTINELYVKLKEAGSEVLDLKEQYFTETDPIGALFPGEENVITEKVNIGSNRSFGEIEPKEEKKDIFNMEMFEDDVDKKFKEIQKKEKKQ